LARSYGVDGEIIREVRENMMNAVKTYTHAKNNQQHMIQGLIASATSHLLIPTFAKERLGGERSLGP
jgi:hypothetical protein